MRFGAIGAILIVVLSLTGCAEKQSSIQIPTNKDGSFDFSSVKDVDDFFIKMGYVNEANTSKYVSPYGCYKHMYADLKYTGAYCKHLGGQHLEIMEYVMMYEGFVCKFEDKILFSTKKERWPKRDSRNCDSSYPFWMSLSAWADSSEYDRLMAEIKRQKEFSEQRRENEAVKRIEEQKVKEARIKELRTRKGQYVLAFFDSYEVNPRAYTDRNKDVITYAAIEGCGSWCQSKTKEKTGYHNLDSALQDGWRLVSKIRDVKDSAGSYCMCYGSEVVLEK